MILYMMIRELDQEKHKTFINVVNVAFAIFAAEEWASKALSNNGKLI